ncbi:MAG: S53 family peptidase [Mycobacterium sp.]
MAARALRLILSGAAAVILFAVVSLAGNRTGIPSHAAVIDGPYGRLLSESADLGPARLGSAQVTVALQQRSEPVRLAAWARSHGLAVRWRDGEDWAVIDGAPAAVADAFAVPLHNYRIRDGADAGRVFYASPQQPQIPEAARSEVAGLGRLLGYTPVREAMPPTVPPAPLEVPDGGLLPSQLLNAYNATPLVRAGSTGKEQTVVVWAFDGFHQEDMDKFADTFSLPRFTPEVIGGMPDHVRGEATMDLQVIHAEAPDAKLILANARSTTTNDGGGAFVKLAALMDSIDGQFPGAVWSFSIGWGCDRLFTASDFTPVRAALTRAISNGTTAFNASGDLAGLECKGGRKWSEPPSPDDVGVDAVASLPEITAIGGTKLSTGADGEWLAEQAWYDSALIQGTGGGASQLFGRPKWQSVGVGTQLPSQRLVPDVSAVADPFTGVRMVLDQQVVVGGGTSQSAPIWAGLTALMNESLLARGSEQVGDLNPLLYKVATPSPGFVPAFHDISLGGNAIMPASTTGYDMVTGLGTPNVANLVRNILLLRAVA